MLLRTPNEGSFGIIRPPEEFTGGDGWVATVTEVTVAALTYRYRQVVERHEEERKEQFQADVAKPCCKRDGQQSSHRG